MVPCDHEEADTRLLIHLQDSLRNDCTNCLVHTVDTDVIVILIGKFHHLTTLCQNVNIWVAFGTGKNFKYYHINAFYEDLGREKSLALPVFHSFTGCDTTSAFFGKGKKSAWEAWKCYHDVTPAFTFMALHPFTEVDADAQHFQLLEHFTVVLYDKTRMKPEKTCFAKRESQWRDLLQPKMHYCNTPSELHIRLEYGAPVNIVNNMHLLQKVGAGHLMKTANRGFRCGTFYLWSPRPIANLLNVAERAKGDVLLGVHAKRQAGGALNSAVATMKKRQDNVVTYIIVHCSTLSVVNSDFYQRVR